MLGTVDYKMFQKPVAGLFDINPDIEMRGRIGCQHPNNLSAPHRNQRFFKPQQGERATQSAGIHFMIKFYHSRRFVKIQTMHKRNQ
jgi:hypothetical protein